MEAKRVAVIGGGLAGLAAAWDLAQRGARVTVLEARSVVGGRMRSDDLDGATIDCGVQLASSTYSAFFKLARDAGAADLLVRSPGRDALWRDGRAHAITYGSVTSMLASSALPGGLKLKLGARYLPFLAARARTLDVNDLVGTGGQEHDRVSAADWGRRELGKDFVELLVYPLLGSYYGSTPEDTSAGLYHALAKVGMEVRVHAVRGGAAALPHALARALEQSGARVVTDAKVRAVRAERGGVVVVQENGEESFDACVLATPAAAASGLLEGADTKVTEWLAGVRTAPTVTVAFALDRALDVDYFGLTFPRDSEPGRTAVAACIQQNKLDGLVPPGRGAVLMLPAPAIAAELAGQDPEQAVNAMLPALEAAFPRVQSSITRARTYAFREGYTVFHPGYVRHLAAYREQWLPAQLALAGDYLSAPTVEGAVRSGLRAARTIARALGGAEG